jgi:hypothetical protein
MLLQLSVFLLALLSGVAAYRLGRSRRLGEAQGPRLRRLATALSWFWLTLSALLFAWAAARLMGWSSAP